MGEQQGILDIEADDVLFEVQRELIEALDKQISRIENEIEKIVDEPTQTNMGNTQATTQAIAPEKGVPISTRHVPPEGTKVVDELGLKPN